MKKLIPKSDTVVAFLRLKGWIVVDKSDGYYVLTPPEDIQPQSIRYKIPYYEKELTYPLLIRERVKEIAELYGWKKNNLLLLLSKKVTEIELILQKFVKTEIEKVEDLKAKAS